MKSAELQFYDQAIYLLRHKQYFTVYVRKKNLFASSSHTALGAEYEGKTSGSTLFPNNILK